MSEAHKLVIETGYSWTSAAAQGGSGVTGVDFSAKQLELERRNVPGTSFLKADMTYLDFASKERGVRCPSP